jgi:hypothetical protein
MSGVQRTQDYPADDDDCAHGADDAARHDQASGAWLLAFIAPDRFGRLQGTDGAIEREHRMRAERHRDQQIARPVRAGGALAAQVVLAVI